MSFQVISNPSFLDPSEQARFYAFFVSSLVTICVGFNAAGRDGLMFDTRVVRGLHRLPRYGLALFFFLYSIFLSIPQWIMNSDENMCSESFHFNNETNKLIIATECAHVLKTINILYLVVILIDPFYIFFFLCQPDYRSAEQWVDKIKIRTHQQRRFIVSFILLFIKVSIITPRFILILISGNVGAIILSAMNLTLLTFNFFVHIRCLMLYSHVFKINSSLAIVDMTAPTTSKRRNTSSDDDHHIQSGFNDDHDMLTDDDDDDKNGLVKNSLIPQSGSSRPRQKVSF